ncbi:hypothetical protein MNBD_CHLOROFLEXI01-2225 [hydrothermal vent metagenome]|uniref:DUF5668 domain-containing protein n=1 Tax=hydrothermal vent metagenome TaxID=652676 RepID=A0A3B0V1K2_9ZZZZ
MDNFNDGRRHKNGRSLFGSFFLIGLGIYFLLRNMGIVSDLNWAVAFQLWPLLLIFGGLNIIVQQVRRPFGTALSGLVSLTAVTVFGAILLFGVELPFLSRFNLQTSAEYRQEIVEVSGDGVETSEISLDLSRLKTEVTGLNSSQNLLEGTLSIAGELNLQEEVRGSKATISLGEHSPNFWSGGWVAGSQQPPWKIGLSRTIPMDLTIDMGSGSADLLLASLLLTDLNIDIRSGSMNLQLPGGEYDIRLDGGSGRMEVALPANGHQELIIDGASGSISLSLPPNMAARMEIDKGSGSVSVDGRFTQTSGDDHDLIWETPNYQANSDNAILIIIDGGSGSITIEQPQGR